MNRRSLLKNLQPARLMLCALTVCLPLLLAQGVAGAPVTSQVTESQPQPSAPGRQERLAVFDEVWEAIAARYYDPSLRGLDWAALRAKFRPQAAEARGTSALYVVLRRMIAHLDDPHTRVYAPEETSDWSAPRFVAVGLSVREIAGELVVVRVERRSEAERAGVRAGDVVESVGGETVSSVLARRLQEQPTGTQKTTGTARLLAVSKVFDGPRDTVVPVVFRGSDGRARSVHLRRELRTRAPELRARRVGGRFGLIQFNTFTPATAAEFARSLNHELREARALIVDLRENGGGESEAMNDIASIFLGAGLPLGKFTARTGRTESEPHTRSTMLSMADALPRSRLPLIVLTGARTASASEIFVAALRERGRARIIGETTCGCVLAIRRRQQLSDGGALDISEMDFHTALGVRLEGNGMTPDEKIIPTRQDVRAGRDRVLERAIEILKATVK
jgi:C-terminal peptidase prc